MCKRLALRPMKKVLLILLAFFVLFIGALVAIPFLFKDKLVEYARTAANEHLDAKVDFGDFSLSLIRSFPNFSFRIHDVTVDNKEPFEGVRLAEVGTLEFTLNLLPLLNGRVVINEFGLSNTRVDVRVLEDGSANYNITKSDDEADVEEVVSEEESDFKLELKRYFLHNFSLLYDDVPLLTRLEIEGLNHEGSGDFSQNVFTLSTTSTIDMLNVDYDGIRYMRKARVKANADIDMDFNTSKYTLRDNEIFLNELELGVDGWVAMPEDPIDMDLTWFAKKTDFRHFLSLIPAEFASDLTGVDVTGNFGLNGFVRGTYSETDYPGFSVDMQVSNGRFKYPDLPSSADNIAIQCNIDHPGGDLDNMVVNLSKFHVDLANNPFDFTLLLKHPMSDPDLDARLRAALDFSKLGEVIPMDDELKGSFDADVTAKGRYSAIEEERYEDFEAAGHLNLRDFEYHSTDGYDMLIHEAAFSFNPRYAEMSAFNMEMPGMDLQAEGRLENYIAYVLKDSTLVGQLNMRSKKIDVSAFLDDDETEAAAEEATEAEAYTAIEIPGNIRFTMNAAIDELLYDGISMTNVSGGIDVVDQQVKLRNLVMDVLDGKVTMNGAYNVQNPTKPKVDFSYDIRNMDIRQTADNFVTVERFAPLAKKATGKFSSKMNFTSYLDHELNPDLESVYGKGSVETKSVFIEGFEPLNELARVLKIERLATQNIQDVRFTFEILNGRAYIQPFDVKIDQINTNIAGSTGLDQTLDYAMRMTIPTKMLQGGALDMVQGLIGQAGALLGQEVSIGDKIDVDIAVGGTVEKPTFRPSFGGMTGGKSPADLVKDKIKEEMDKAREEVVGRAVDEARAQAERILNEAQKQADAIRKEAKNAADRVRSEGRAAAKKLEDEAGNPIARAAARAAGEKLIREADQRADQIEREANTRAQGIVDGARKQGDKLIDDAKATVE